MIRVRLARSGINDSVCLVLTRVDPCQGLNLQSLLYFTLSPFPSLMHRYCDVILTPIANDCIVVPPVTEV